MTTSTAGLAVPDVAPGDDPMAAALRYAAGGWYVLPVNPATKHAGSVLGQGWPGKSSRDQEQIIDWFAGTAHAVALHAGRSGAIIFDVDEPHLIPDVLADAIAATKPPHQSTRSNIEGRGHHLFAVPEGRVLGNSRGKLGKDWGEVRGRNGIIVVAPSEHEKEAEGGRYLWLRTGVLPVLPDELSELLPESGEAGDAATDAELARFLGAQTSRTRPELLAGVITQFNAAVASGQSRHEAALLATAGAMREALAGYYPATEAAGRMRDAFINAMATARGGSDRVRGPGAANSEFLGILAWAVGQARTADPAETRSKVEARIPQRDEYATFEALIADPDPRPEATPLDARTARGEAPEQPRRHLAAVPTPPSDGTAALQVDEPEPDAGPATYTRTDDGNALRLVDAHHQEIRYCPQRGRWLVWDRHVWAWDEAGRVRELVKRISRELTATNAGDSKHRAYSLSARGTSAALQQACTDARVVAPVGLLDAAPLHLNTPGGVVDLLTGEVTPPAPDGLHTRSALVAPDFDMRLERWSAFLTDTFGGDLDMIPFVRRLAGYSASGDVRHHILPFLHGGGQNGKSVLMDVLRHLLGDYAAPAPPGFLMAGKQDHLTEMARLQGLRLVVASEVNQDAKFDEAKMKELTGGDTLTARFMRQDHFTFEPTHHLWLMGNHQPQVSVGGDSFWRRLRLVPFLHRVPDEKKVENLASILVDEEGPGILAWIVRGAVDAFKGGLREPGSVMAATRAYAAEEDHLGRFLEGACHRGPAAHLRVETKHLRAAYEKWCHAEGESPMSARALGRELKQREIPRKDSNGRAFYAGLALIADEPDPRDAAAQ